MNQTTTIPSSVEAVIEDQIKNAKPEEAKPEFFAVPGVDPIIVSKVDQV